MRVMGLDMDRCPLSTITQKAASLIGFLNSCEGGMGNSILPSALLEETNYYLNVSRIVSSERGRISRLTDNKD